MELITHYWDYFVQVEAQTIQSFLRRMEIYASGKVSLHYYLTYFSTLLILLFLFSCEFVFPWRRQDVDSFPTTFWGQLVYPFQANLTRAARAVAAPFRTRSGPASPS